MAQYFQIHPRNPQGRRIHQVATILQQGGILAYPTDSSYALGCTLGNKEAMDAIRRIRRVDNDHHFSLVCRDLSEVALYARIDNQIYRLLKRFTPGPYTFILPATREVPRRLQHPKRRTIGLRIPDYPIVSSLLAHMSKPLMSSTLILPADDLPLNDAEQIREVLEHAVDGIVDGGPCDLDPTTVVDLTSGLPEVVRPGKGEISSFEGWA